MKETHIGGVQHYVGDKVVTTFKDAIVDEDDDAGWGGFLLYQFTSIKTFSLVKLISIYNQQIMLPFKQKHP